jgi:hydrogenase expression/formation protein HypC
MCLAIPMKIVAMREPGIGVTDLDGIRQTVNLSLVSEPKLGDYVIVHAGFAIEKLDEEEANERIALFEELVQMAVPAAPLAGDPADGQIESGETR